MPNTRYPDAFDTLRIAFEHYQSGHAQAAVASGKQVLAALPGQPDALYLLAIVHAQAKDFAAANSYFERAIASDASRAEFFGNFANVLWEQGRIDEAVAQCAQSLALDPSRAEVHNTLGNALFAQERFAAAADSFRRAVQCNPAYASAHNNIGNALLRQGQHEEAVDHYRRAIACKADYPEAFNNLGQALKDGGRIAEAEQAFRQALALKPNYANATRNLAQVDHAWLAPLAGRRIELRRTAASDVDFLLHCYRDVAFMDRYHHFISRQQSREQLAEKLCREERRHPCQSMTLDWLLLKTETGGDGVSASRSIGIANLVDIQFAHRRAEFLIGIPDPCDRAASAGLEATLLVMDFAFNRVGLNKLTTFVYGDNQASQNNTLALGFTQESHLREHLALPDSGRLIDLYGNGMTVGDFRSNTRLARSSRRLLGRDVTMQG